MPKPIKPRLQMGCGEPLCGSLRRLRDLIRRPLARAADQRRSRIASARRSIR